MGGVGVDELRQERKEEERGLRIQDVDDDALCECAAKVPLASQRGPARACREERPEPEPDEVGGTGDLDGGERDRRGDDERGEPERRRADVDERPDVDPEHGREPRTPALLDRPRDDVEHRRPGHEQKRERGDREDREPARVGNHGFSSHTMRSPSSVRKGSTFSIVRECGATRSARPPVATAGASAPSSSRMRPTMPSTCPAKP